MQGFSFVPQTIHIIRVDPGEDVLVSVRDYAAAAGMRQAVVMGAYGTLAAHSLHWVTHNRIPTENRFGRGAGGIEILSMNGLIVEGEPHIHVTLATEAGAYGGHLEPGCTAYVICEVFLAEIVGEALRRARVTVDVPGMGRGTITRLVAEESRGTSDG
ncbi:MAG: DNA-binding protein [Candidatus Marinimicrobia bacterium]|nr:DNA-binding protein [Candidatus Neomarinimicrobiota bacterium]